jgi:hypothetical protein
MNAPSTETSCPNESGTSPVPGGMSTTRTSRPRPWGSAPRQSTSKRSCCTAFCTMRPRQVTGASAPGSRNPMDMAGSPWFVSGMRAPPEGKCSELVDQGNCGARITPKRVRMDVLDVRWGSPTDSRPRSLGIEGPKMSRSSTPTRARLVEAREKARFTGKEKDEITVQVRSRRRTNRPRYSCPHRPYRWQRRRPFSRVECHA